MLRFDVYNGGAPARQVDLSGAYVFGQDGIPIRADIAVAGAQITCTKRVPGACGIALLWDAGVSGRFLLPTTRLAERKEPYNLNVELARSQITRIIQKREDWGLFDYSGAEQLNKEFDAVRRKFIESLKADDPAAASVLADQALASGVTLGEKMALFHADVLLGRRKAPLQNNPPFGCVVDPFSTKEEYVERLRTFDFLNIPMFWKLTEPKERQYQYAQVDAWVNWASRNKKPIHAGPLLSFEPARLPEWLYLFEHDYEALRDQIYEHIQRIVQRYEKHVRIWTVVSGIHAYNSFNLSFEQLMELTRMSCLLVKKLAPHCQVMIELTMPFGEYYARNARTIPALLYADMAVQGGVKFDAFGIQTAMGVPIDGYYVRDLMQVSSLLDELVSFSKPLHITAAEVPSDMSSDAWDAWGGKELIARAGQWHADWSQRLQAEWLQAFYRIALSKPYVETVCWRDLADYEGHFIPHGGLCRNDMEPKMSFKELRALRSAINAKPPTKAEAAANGKAPAKADNGAAAKPAVKNNGGHKNSGKK